MCLPQRLAAVAQRFGDMHAADPLGAVEIGERARDPQRPMEATRRQVQRLRRLAQQGDAFGVGCSDLLENTPAAIGVGAHRARPECCEARTLELARPRHSRPHLRASLGRRRQHHVGGRQRRHLDLQIDAVEKRPEMRAW
jgi:hypothetical protein